MLIPKHTAHKRAEFHGYPGESYIYLHEIHGDDVVNTWCLYGIGHDCARIVHQSKNPKHDDTMIIESNYQYCYCWMLRRASEIQASNPLQVGEEVILLGHSEDGWGVISTINNDNNTCKVDWNDPQGSYKFTEDFMPLDILERRRVVS